MLVYKTTFSKYVFRSRNLPFVMWTCCNHSERRRLFQGGKKGKYFLLVNKQLKNGCTVLSIWHDFLALRRVILSLKNRGLWGSFNSTAIYVLNAKTFQKIKATSILTVLLFFFLSVATTFMTMKTFSQQMLTYGPAQPHYRPSQPILVTIREHELERNNSAISDLKPSPIFLTQLPKLLQKQHHAF